MTIVKVLSIVLVNSMFHVMCLEVQNYELNETEYHLMPELFAVDNYPRCLNDETGVYCMAQLYLYEDNGNNVMQIIKKYSSFTIIRYNHSYIERGVCIRDTCHKYMKNSSIIRNDLENCINQSLWTKYGVKGKINKYYCDKTSEVPRTKDAFDWIVICVYALVLLASLVGTSYDLAKRYLNHETKIVTGYEYLLCFSIRRNWKKLTEDEKANSFATLHGMKTIVSLTVILTHVFFYIGSGRLDNAKQFEQAYQNLFFSSLFNGLTLVQVFFLISAFLWTYNLESSAKTKQITFRHYLIHLCNRWWRLSMSYIVVLSFACTWLQDSGSGPVWKASVTETSETCRKFWWAHLLYINNLIPDDVGCLYQTWHIACDTQLFALGLALYLSLRCAPRIRMMVLTALLAAGLVAPAIDLWLRQDSLDGLAIMSPQYFRWMSSDATYRYLHILTYNNVFCYVLGIIVAISFHRIQNYKVSNYKKVIKLLSNAVVWAVVPGYVLVFRLGALFYCSGGSSPLVYRMLYAIVHRAGIGVVTALAGFVCVMKWDDTWLASMLKWRGWNLPSRLSYLVYLIHPLVIQYLLAITTQPLHFDTFTWLSSVLLVYGWSLVIAVPMFLLVESPAQRLAKLLLQPYMYGRMANV